MKIKAADGFWDELIGFFEWLWGAVCYLLVPPLWICMASVVCAIVIVGYLPSLGHSKKLLLLWWEYFGSVAVQRYIIY